MQRHITSERRFYDWIVDYMHQHGDMRLYPKAVVEAAELAIEAIDDEIDEEELLPELFPGARISEFVKTGNQELGLAFHLASDGEKRPYSSTIIQFLARCFRPRGISAVEEAARIGFKVSGLHRTGYFTEYKRKQSLHLVTTDCGVADLGISVHLKYPADSPFFSDGMIEEAADERKSEEDIQARLSTMKRSRTVRQGQKSRQR